MKRILLLVFSLMLGMAAQAWNVKITKAPSYDVEKVTSTLAEIHLSVEWEGSWRDAHNWDAVYIFLKCKKATDITWSHVLLRDRGHVAGNGFECYTAVHPGGTANRAPGLFVYRAAKGGGKSTVDLVLKWNYANNGLSQRDMQYVGVSIEAMAIEMVYIPKGPFRPGDQCAKKGFQKTYRQILPEWDLIGPDTKILLPSWYNSVDSQFEPTEEYWDPGQVADRDNDIRTTSAPSAWVSPYKHQADIIFEFDSPKTVRYMAIELYANALANWNLHGSNTSGMPKRWNKLGSFEGALATLSSNQAYPAKRAVPVDNSTAYKYYKVELTMASTSYYAYVRTISMTDKNLEELTDDAYIIDGPGNTINFNTTDLGLNVKDGSLSGSLNVNYAVGYEGFFAMKYEISQRQYVDFLNKLSIEEQKARTIGEQLTELEMGDYVYGAGDHKAPVCRNGIVVGALQDNRYAFACNLTPGGSDNKGYNEANDGEYIACNFLSPNDMMAYASWSGLRPLSELEYEKMGHQTIDSLSGKVSVFPIGGYAWGNAVGQFPSNNRIDKSGQADEKLSSAHANIGGYVTGPVRCGSFSNGTSGLAQSSGASFYGVMELSGNLAEIYYRAEPGKEILYQTLASHGDGQLTAAGEMHTDREGYWGRPKGYPVNCGNSLILRGGSFASRITDRAMLADRGEENGYAGGGLNRKDSTVTFRLGHSVTALETNNGDYYTATWLTNENGMEAYEGMTMYDTVCLGVSGYTIIGSDPVADGFLVPSGEVRYVWYVSKDGTPYTPIVGKNGKDLRLTAADLEHYSHTYRTYSYKRRFYTPTQYSESGVVALRVGTNSPFTRDKEERLRVSNQINGVLVESMPKATFQWYSDMGKGWRALPAYHTTEYSSYLSVVRDSFPAAGQGTLICEVTTKELGCKKTVTVPITVEARPTTGIPSASFMSQLCGRSAVKDLRDGEIYTTVKIGNQCWMAENMRYRGTMATGSMYYSPVDPQGKMYGVEYYAYYTNIPLICPEGWVVPSVTDFNTLKAMANIDGESPEQEGFRLRAGNFWLVGRAKGYYNDYIYAKEWNHGQDPTGIEKPCFNELGFGLMGGGYDSNNPHNSSYNMAVLMARYPNYGGQYVWRMTYDGKTFSHWTYGGFYTPVRCILKSTSVD